MRHKRVFIFIGILILSASGLMTRGHEGQLHPDPIS